MFFRLGPVDGVVPLVRREADAEAPDRLVADAALGQIVAGGPGAREAEEAPPDGIDPAAARRAAAEQIMKSYDKQFGGFGGAPKFPQPCFLALLLQHAVADGHSLARDEVLATLRKMAEGGIYDQLAGGFHRYAVDQRWLVPHFEKMLYDNALLVPLYLDAGRLSGDAF